MIRLFHDYAWTLGFIALIALVELILVLLGA